MTATPARLYQEDNHLGAQLDEQTGANGREDLRLPSLPIYHM